MLTVDGVDILTISELKLIKTVSVIYYNYFSQDYSKCSDTDSVETDGITYQIELMPSVSTLSVSEHLE